MAMNARTKLIRAAVKHVDGVWVDGRGEGPAWVGTRCSYARDDLRQALTNAGLPFAASDSGPGTEGEHHLQVFVYN